ncbi:TetR/AcrR family transcriptional regulator [Streptomyces polygonati]|uniref:TetR/AcrR family transcriptional regulator n=1 Tax=Streptomyces polygonati TaxID=1617087 RepID=A0ABV8HXB1_9ACTN
MTPPDADKPYHHGNLRAELLGHAERMLAEGGQDALSLRELARGAGVSHGAPRRHFADRQALLDALAEEGFRRLRRELDAAMAGAGGPFAARLAAFAQAYVGFATRHTALLRLMHTIKDRPGAEGLRRANDLAFAAPMALIDRARRDGEIVADDPDRVAMAVLALLQGLATVVGAGMAGDRAVPELVSGAVLTLVEGLRPRDEGPAAR